MVWWRIEQTLPDGGVSSMIHDTPYKSNALHAGRALLGDGPTGTTWTISPLTPDEGVIPYSMNGAQQFASADDPLMRALESKLSGQSPTASDASSGGAPAPPDDPLLEKLSAAVESTPQTLGDQIGRAANIAGQSAWRGIGASVASVPDLIEAGLRAAGLPPSLTLPPGHFQELANRGLDMAFGPEPVPASPVERGLAKGGEYLGNTMAIATPAGWIARAAPAGTMAQQLAQILASRPAMQGLAAAVGGGTEGVTGSPTAGLAAGIGATVAPNLLATGAARAIAGGAATPEYRYLVQEAQRQGIPLTTADLTGSKTVRALQEMVGRMPGGIEPASERAAAQQLAFNQAALQAGGSGADYATAEVLNQGKAAAGDLINQATQGLQIPLSRDFLSAMDDWRAYMRQMLPDEVAKPINAQIEQVLRMASENPASPSVPGQAMQDLRSLITSKIRTADGPIKRELLNWRSTLDTAAEAAMSPDQQAQWAVGRRQYANMKAIEAAMSRPSAITAQGNIPFAGLSGAVAKSAGTGSYAGGRGDLYDLGRIGQVLLKQQTPNSGTPSQLAPIVWSQIAQSALGFPGAFLAGPAIGSAATRAADAALQSGIVRSLLARAGARVANAPPVLPLIQGQLAAAILRQAQQAGRQ